MRSENSQQGHVFEQDIKAAFRAAELIHPIRFCKITDTGNAGRVIGPVDGDFELTANSGIPGQPYRFNIEAKSSRANDTLTTGFRQLIKTGQIARMRLAVRAGAYGVYLFKSVESNDFEVWSCKRILDVYYANRKPLEGVPAYRFAMQNIEWFAMEVSKNPKKFLQDLIRSET